MKLLHIVIDNKFIDGAIREFEKAFPGGNEFICFSNSVQFALISSPLVQTVSPEKIGEEDFVAKMKTYPVIVFHWLSNYSLDIIEMLHDTNIKFCWIGWGGDYYDIITNSQDVSPLLLDSTLELYGDYRLLLEKESLENERKKYNNLGCIGKVKRKLFPQRYDVPPTEDFLLRKKRIIKRINYFAPVIPQDFKLVKGATEDFRAKYCEWRYGTIEDDLVPEKLGNIVLKSNNILVGNSAFFTCNHIESFNLLSHLDLSDRKITVPLSYGIDFYKNKILFEGDKCFRDKFDPVLEFMPIEQYVNYLSSCSVVIMNHRRQQAVGNIVIMLYLGAKVFLRNENPVKEFLTENGIEIFDINKINNEFIFDSAQIKDQRERLIHLWGRDVVKQNTKNLIDGIFLS